MSALIPLVAVWSNEAETLGSSKSHGASSQLLKEEPLYVTITDVSLERNPCPELGNFIIQRLDISK
jgi:hypothetical protein